MHHVAHYIVLLWLLPVLLQIVLPLLLLAGYGFLQLVQDKGEGAPRTVEEPALSLGPHSC